MAQWAGMLLVFEGPDNVGKTSLAQAVAKQLQRHHDKVLSLAFPGNEGGTLGSLVYGLQHHPEQYNIKDLDPLSRQAMHIAAHIDAIGRQILPALKDGSLVVLDRFWWSTLVYGLMDNVERHALELLVNVEQTRWGTVAPQVVFLVMRDSSLCPDETPSRFARLSELYRELAAKEAREYPVICIDNNDFGDSLLEIFAYITRRLGQNI